MGRTEANNGITRRDFVKGLAAGAAGLGLVSILPGGIISAAAADTKKEDVGKKGDGIYIDGVAENLKGKKYTLEFVQPIKLVAVHGGKVQTEGTWRTSNKHLVSVDPDGTVVMRDGVGGYDVMVPHRSDGRRSLDRSGHSHHPRHIYDPSGPILRLAPL